MKKIISVFMITLMVGFTASLFAKESNKSVGIVPVQDSERTADSERAAKSLFSKVSKALIKVKKYTISELKSKDESKDLDYLLEMTVIKYAEQTGLVRKMQQKVVTYEVEVKLTQIKKSQIIIQDTIKGTYEGEKVPQGTTPPDVYAVAMEIVGNQVSDLITSALFPITVLKVGESKWGPIITIPNYGFEVGDVLEVHKEEGLQDESGKVVASESILVCPIIVLEVSGSVARAMIHTLKPYKSKYAKATVEVGMKCKRSKDARFDEKAISSLLKTLKKATK